MMNTKPVKINKNLKAHFFPDFNVDVAIIKDRKTGQDFNYKGQENVLWLGSWSSILNSEVASGLP